MRDPIDPVELAQKAMSNSLVKIAQGNVGCLAAIMHVMNKYETVTFPIIVSLLLSDLRGTQIYVLFNDECKRDVDLFFEKIMGLNNENGKNHIYKRRTHK